MFTIEITESAENDLDSIVDYLSYELANPSAARAFLDAIELVSETIEDNPEMFPLCSDTRLAEQGYRKAVIRAYIMIYEIDTPQQIVRVMRFFHESENYAGRL